jgi:hypothetical protein
MLNSFIHYLNTKQWKQLKNADAAKQQFVTVAIAARAAVAPAGAVAALKKRSGEADLLPVF